MAKCNESAIREAAYYIWQSAGCPVGNDEYFWAMAVEQLSGSKSSKTTKASATSKCATKKSSTTTSSKKPVAKKTTAKKAKK